MYPAYATFDIQYYAKAPKIFKLYNGSIFRFVDKARLVYSIISRYINLEKA